MPLKYATGPELDLGISYAFERFGCTIQRHNLEMVANRLVYNRDINGLPFADALRTTLNEYKFSGERREWYKAALGKLFGSRNTPMHRGIVPVLDKQKPLHVAPLDKNGQFLLKLTF